MNNDPFLIKLDGTWDESQIFPQINSIRFVTIYPEGLYLKFFWLTRISGRARIIVMGPSEHALYPIKEWKEEYASLWRRFGFFTIRWIYDKIRLHR